MLALRAARSCCLRTRRAYFRLRFVPAGFGGTAAAFASASAACLWMAAISRTWPSTPLLASHELYDLVIQSRIASRHAVRATSCSMGSATTLAYLSSHRVMRG